jgi:hypothetical protein
MPNRIIADIVFDFVFGHAGIIVPFSIILTDVLEAKPVKIV